jgi:DNA-binding NtrC family response regulator
VTGFTDPHLALRAIRSAPDRFKALVTDLTMPHLTGLQLLEEARKVSPGLPAVIISGYGQGIDGQPIELKPDSQLLAKPFDGEDLAAALHDVLQKPAKPSG